METECRVVTCEFYAYSEDSQRTVSSSRHVSVRRNMLPPLFLQAGPNPLRLNTARSMTGLSKIFPVVTTISFTFY
jgi:hypothetical protein